MYSFFVVWIHLLGAALVTAIIMLIIFLLFLLSIFVIVFTGLFIDLCPNRFWVLNRLAPVLSPGPPKRLLVLLE